MMLPDLWKKLKSVRQPWQQGLFTAATKENLSGISET
jgi:hypothetical protein